MKRLATILAIVALSPVIVAVAIYAAALCECSGVPVWVKD